MNAKDKIKITYLDRALILCLPVPLLRVCATPMPLDVWPWRLEAVCAGVSALAADPPLPVDTAGVEIGRAHV